MELFANLISLLAIVIGTFLMLPQLIKSIKTKNLKDVSTGMLIMYFLNCLFWLIHGILIKDFPVILTNAIALIISIWQLVLKIKYK